ncbi:hypothetical protein NMG60_11033031 [Bertholletia excelsa]
MVEGGIAEADKTEFLECWRTSWRTPYIMRLALTAGIGGFLFGYDTGVISGALLYIKEDFRSVEKSTLLQEVIVSMAVAGAIVGAAMGGWLNDHLGRKMALLIADFLFFVGSVVMAVAPTPGVIILGRIFVGFGVGMASMTSPLYISEASPVRIRGALVSTNNLLITIGQFMSYLINLAFTNVTGTWRWMLGVAAVPAIVQFVLMLSLPESPRWMYSNGKTEEARAILGRIYPADEEERAREMEIGETTIMGKVSRAFGDVVVRRALYAGILVQVVQQFGGINTVMYYSPTIVQLAGFASNNTALALSLVTSGLNAVGSIISMFFVDRYGRRRLMIISLTASLSCLVALSGVFFEASANAPKVSRDQTAHFSANSTCSRFVNAKDPSSWNCMTCIQKSNDCAFCTNPYNSYHPGACLAVSKAAKVACKAEKGTWYTSGCPSKAGIVAIFLLGLYIVTYGPGMGPPPWIINSEIYPLRFRGICGGIAAVANWVSNLVISLSFLTLTVALSPAGTFLLFAGFCFIGLVLIYLIVPETKGLQYEEIEKILQEGYRPWKKNPNKATRLPRRQWDVNGDRFRLGTAGGPLMYSIGIISKNSI